MRSTRAAGLALRMKPPVRSAAPADVSRSGPRRTLLAALALLAGVVALGTSTAEVAASATSVSLSAEEILLVDTDGPADLPGLDVCVTASGSYVVVGPDGGEVTAVDAPVTATSSFPTMVVTSLGTVFIGQDTVGGCSGTRRVVRWQANNAAVDALQAGAEVTQLLRFRATADGADLATLTIRATGANDRPRILLSTRSNVLPTWGSSGGFVFGVDSFPTANEIMAACGINTSDGTSVGWPFRITAGSSPPAEACHLAFDGLTSTKYLNFTKPGSTVANNPSVVIDAGTQVVVTGLALHTANDSQERDPTSFSLLGSNDDAAFLGTGGTWNPIVNGLELQPPTDRFAAYPTVSFSNTSRYRYYRLRFDSIRTPSPSTALQVSRIAMPGGLEGGPATFTTGGPAVTIEPVLSLLDPDSNIVSATVTIGAGSAAGDSLDVDTSGSDLDASWHAAEQRLTITAPAGGASPAAFQALLRTVTFETTSATLVERTITWTATDVAELVGTATSMVLVSNVAVVEAEAAPPSVTTGAASSVTADSATLSGTVTSDGGQAVTERGFVISTSPSPTIGAGATKLVAGIGLGAFTATASDLESGTQYHVRAFATNSKGTTYGNEVTFSTSAVVAWSGSATGNLVLNEAFSLDLDALTTAGGGGLRTYSITSGTLPAGLTLSGSTVGGTVTDESLVGDAFVVAISVSEAASGTTAAQDLTFTVTTFGTLRTTDYGTAPTSGGAYCWRGYAFKTSSETIITSLIGGGTIAYNVTNEFRGALYSANVDGSGNPASVGTVLADVRFPDNTVNQRVALDEPVTLAPDTWYFLMQGRVTGSVLHWYVQSLDAGDLVTASARITAWLPSSGAPGQAFFGACGGAASGNEGLTVGGTLGTTNDKPAVGLEFLTTSKPPQVTTVGLVDGVMTGELAAGSPGAVGYIQHGTSIDSGSRLDLIGGRTGGQTFGLPLSGISGITGATYSFRARAINDAGAANGATVDITTKAQTLTGWSFPSALSGGVIYGHGTIPIPGVTTSASGTATATPTVTSTTTGVCTVSSSASGGSRDVTVTIVGAGACTLRASHPGGWDGTDLYRSIQSDITLNVAPLPIGIRGSFTVQARTYDGTTVATIAENDLLPDPDVRIGVDVISLTGITLAFDAPDVGSRSVSITSAALTGAHASRYALTIVGAPTASGEITAIPLTVTGGSITAADKAYDGTDVAVVTPSGLTLSGFASGDSMADITWEPAGRFTTTPVGSGITVELVGGAVFGGPKGANYTLDVTGAPTASASITPRPVTVTGASVAARPYDGTTAVTIAGASLANVVAGDAVTLANATSGVAASRDAGTQAVSTSMTLAGAAASNYSLVGQPSLSVTITPLPVSVTMNALPARAYDGTSTIALTPAAFSVSGALPGESIGISGTAVLSSRSPGTRTVTLAAPTFTPGAGTDLANYTLPSSVTGSVTVTPLTLRIAGATVTQRPWDGTTSATITGARLDGLRAGDNVSLTGATSGVFSSSQPGTHPVRFTPTLAGVDAINYTLVVPELTGTIARAPASLRITGGLTQFADGSPRTVRAAVSPASAGRAVVTYPGGSAPSAPGSYPVSVTLDSATHTAEPLSVTLTISPLDALVLPTSTSPAPTTPGTSPTPATPVDDARRAEVLARVAVRTDGTLALPEIGPVLEPDGTAPAFRPREHRVLEDGEPTTARIVVVEDQRVRVETDDDSFSIELQAAVATDDGRIPLPVDADGTLLLDRDGLVDISGTGFLPGSTAEVWMFSEATFLGTAIVAADGSFRGSFPVDELLEPGDHTIQLNGFATDGRVRSASLGVRISDEPVTQPEPERVTVISALADGPLGGRGPVALLLLAAALGALVTRWWLIGKRRRDDEDEDRLGHLVGDASGDRERSRR